MFKTIARTLAIAGFVVITAVAATPRDAAAAGTIGKIGDTGVAKCYGAYGTGAAHFVSVQRPIAYAFNQHTASVDKQRLRSNAVLYRWNGSAWQVAYTPAGQVIQTGWTSEIVSDGQDKTMQLSGYTTYLGNLTIPRDGYYAIRFDLRWDATNTVTVSGDKQLWATPFEDNGSGFWLGPRDYCTYVPQQIAIDLGW